MGWQWKVEFNGRTVRSSFQHRLGFLGNDTCWHREVKPTLTVTWCWIGSRYMTNVSTVLQSRSLSPAVGPDRSILCLTCLVYIHLTCSGLWWSVTTLQQLVNTKPKPFATRWFSPSSPGSNILLSSVLFTLLSCLSSLLRRRAQTQQLVVGGAWLRWSSSGRRFPQRALHSYWCNWPELLSHPAAPVSINSQFKAADGSSSSPGSEDESASPP